MTTIVKHFIQCDYCKKLSTEIKVLQYLPWGEDGDKYPKNLDELLSGWESMITADGHFHFCAKKHRLEYMKTYEPYLPVKD